MSLRADPLHRARVTPAWVDGLLGRCGSLYFDTAFGDAASVYPLSQQRHARVWDTLGALKAEWRDLIVAHPRRFLSALDPGGDSMDQIVAYDRSAWALLFGEEFARAHPVGVDTPAGPRCNQSLSGGAVLRKECGNART